MNHNGMLYTSVLCYHAQNCVVTVVNGSQIETGFLQISNYDIQTKCRLWSTCIQDFRAFTLHGDLVTSYGDIDLGPHWLRELSDGTKPSAEPMLTFYQCDFVAFTRVVFHRKCPRNLSWIWVWKFYPGGILVLPCPSGDRIVSALYLL